MARVTEKYTDPIELAKAQAIADYTTKKTSLVPTEIVDLPSEGKFYPQNHPLRSGKIEMRYMTAYDEDILTNASYIRNGIAIDKLLEALIITPEVDYGEILNCDKDALVVAARILSYGKNYDAIVTTPNQKPLKVVIDLSKISLINSLIGSDADGTCTFKDNVREIKFRFLTINQQNSVRNSEKPLFQFLIESIVSINGESNKEKITEYLQYNMLVSDSKALRMYIVNNLPTLDLESEFEDEDGGIFKSVFQVGPNFFYPEY